MYAYYIDEWVEDRAHRKQRDLLDLRLTQKGVAGRKTQMARIRDLAGSIKENIRSGVRDFVALGDDTTASKLLNGIMRATRDVSVQHADARQQGAAISLAIMPLREPDAIARSFGIAGIDDAVAAIAAHHAISIDVGCLNNRHYFLTAALFPLYSSLEFSTYRMSSLREHHLVGVCNTDIFQPHDAAPAGRHFIPTDHTLEAVIAHPSDTSVRMRGKKDQHMVIETIYPFKKIRLYHRDKVVTVHADTEKQLSTPVEVNVVPRAIQFIVGTNYAPV